MYRIETPNKLYNGVSEGVAFASGVGMTDDENIRNILVNDYGYKDTTPKPKTEDKAAPSKRKSSAK